MVFLIQIIKNVTLTIKRIINHFHFSIRLFLKAKVLFPPFALARLIFIFTYFVNYPFTALQDKINTVFLILLHISQNFEKTSIGNEHSTNGYRIEPLQFIGIINNKSCKSFHFIEFTSDPNLKVCGLNKIQLLEAICIALWQTQKSFVTLLRTKKWRWGWCQKLSFKISAALKLKMSNLNYIIQYNKKCTKNILESLQLRITRIVELL